MLSGRAATPLAVAATTTPDSIEDVEPAVAGLAAPPREEGAPNAWPDDSMEASMVSELRERGEKPGAAPAVEAEVEIDPKNFPPLNELVNRLSPEVREVLEDLFRVKHVRVTRVPQKALAK